jgi:vacuolar-type H+-ATPase subunit I/STV1
MKTKILITILTSCIFSTSTFGQNKKKQIEILNSKVDSLKNEIVIRDNQMQEYVKQSKLQIENLESEVEKKVQTIVQKEQTIKSSTEKNAQLESEISKYKQQIDKQTEEINRLSNLLIKKEEELEKIKNPITSDYLIDLKNKSVGSFKVGDKMPTSSNIFSFTKKTIDHSTDEGIEKVPIYSVLENKVEVLQLWSQYNYETDKYSNNIGEIQILAPQFKTDKGIGVKSTIEEFVKAYPQAIIEYSYICGCVWLQVDKNNDAFQFHLEKNSILDSSKLGYSAFDNLKLTNIKKGSKIKSVRIWRY